MGILAIIVPLIFIGIAILLAPWFSWYVNALSDLGHAMKSNVAVIFNIGIHAGGLLLLIYGLFYVRRLYSYTGLAICLTGYFLQLVAIFDEIYGHVHFIVSVLFFLMLALASIMYSYERKSIIPLISLIIGVSSWILFFTNICKCGVAVPEIASVLAVLLWYVEMCYTIAKN